MHHPSPKSYLEQTMNTDVTLYMRKKKKYLGKLIGMDEHCNVLLDNAYEECDDNVRVEIGRALINGGSIAAIEFFDENER
ncbi:Small Nuclear ribonucleoprotein G [Trachipleistophora hominis]|uniref:Small Nuclear ribonucleoprotein G n=1 Tax=Trachipleistophora hominis TaxID=72359 RepID=L7JXX6_TRAHO|nr:Small Nuclear ribonucleoprotein G [Trachipleistophora hominis]